MEKKKQQNIFQMYPILAYLMPFYCAIFAWLGGHMIWIAAIGFLMGCIIAWIVLKHAYTLFPENDKQPNSKFRKYVAQWYFTPIVGSLLVLVIIQNVWLTLFVFVGDLILSWIIVKRKKHHSSQ